MKTIFALLLFPVLCFARVGEKYSDFLQSTGFESAATETELDGLQRATHQRDGVTVIVMIWRGEICAEQYNGATEHQLSEILLRQGHNWKLVTQGIWINANGLRARYKNGEMLIATEDGQKIVGAYQDKMAAIKARQNAETLKGF